MPIIEEIVDEDIDNMDYDPTDFEPNNPFDKNMPVEGVQLRPTGASASGVSDTGSVSAHGIAGKSASSSGSTKPTSALGSGPTPVGSNAQMDELRKALEENPKGRELPEHMKEWKVIYPIYLDAARSVSDGRRVDQKTAVKNPICTRIIEAAQALGHEAALELTKSHPKDWANPGRVRINSKLPKRKLYGDICEFMRKYPTTEKNSNIPLFQQLAPFDSVHPIAVPRGMIINDILPGVSPALSAQKSLKESMDMGNMSKMFGGM